MGKLVINADDFGICSGVNKGVVEAYNEGLLTSTTLMTNTPGFEEAVTLAKENPGLGIGIHLNLTFWYPINKDLKTIVDENGKFRYLSFYESEENLDKIDLDEVYREWKTQIDKALDYGIKPTHLDSHHHINSVGQIKDVFLKLAKEYNLPIRNNFNFSQDYKSTDKLIGYFDTIGRVKGIWKAMDTNLLIKDCKTYDSIEIMCHPGYVDYFILNNSSLNVDRAVTLHELKNKKLKTILNENNIELVSFKDI
ncbi:MAG: carbohydrate deacetylase [Anaerococcus sp.]|nr:carbohydrate deacetylase [Anaerococcus sp.]